MIPRPRSLWLWGKFTKPVVLTMGTVLALRDEIKEGLEEKDFALQNGNGELDMGAGGNSVELPGRGRNSNN